MPLPVDLYLDACPDLVFMDKPHRTGTCPACGQAGFSLKLLLWKDKGREYEPFCSAGCTPLQINEAVLEIIDAAETAKAA